MTLRRLVSGDSELLRTWCAEHKALTPTIEEADAFLAQENHVVLMAFEDDPVQPVGLLYGYLLDRIDGRRMGVIYDLEVLERSRRRGHGRALLQAALDALQERRAIAVWLTTGRDNEPALELYRAAGGDEIDDVLIQWAFP